ncbi:hypothetical protein L21SP2_0973 [Salinispira pacifica]|uniref:Uncharacterized protein n=1 Tax=Salinispira pacifica TaxID=1307761 RepID=V5WF06_9SPIO|nr:hypothetical protein L21SP2_0973 [Salinispira pacifica]
MVTTDEHQMVTDGVVGGVWLYVIKAERTTYLFELINEY